MQYHIGQGGQRSGPFEEEIVRSKIADGTLRPQDLCWAVGWTDWKTIGALFPAQTQQTSPDPNVAPALPKAPPLLRIDDRTLVAPLNFDFPAMCLKTGITENLVPKTKRFTWHHPSVYFVILLNLLVYLVIALVIRKSSRHRFYLCRQEALKYRNQLLVTWGLFLGSIGALVTAISLDIDGLFVLFMVGMLLCVIAGFTRARLFYPTKIDASHVHIRGIPREVMEKLVQHS